MGLSISCNRPGPQQLFLSRYLCRKFGEYLRLVDIRYIIDSPYHQQTDGEIERYSGPMVCEIAEMVLINP